MSIYPENYGLLTVVVTCPGVTKELTWGVGWKSNTGVGPATAAATLAGSLDATDRFYHADLLLSGWTFQRVDAMLMTALGPILGSYATNIAGTKTGTAVPVNCSYLIGKSTARGGRKGRGRCFVPVSYNPEGEIDAAGGIAAGYPAAIATRFNQIIPEMSAANCPLYLLHSDSTPPDAITAFACSETIATQRRRMRS